MGFNIWTRTGNGEIFVNDIDSFGTVGGSFKFNTNNITDTPIVEKTSYEPQLLGVGTPDAPSTVDKWSDDTQWQNDWQIKNAQEAGILPADPVKPMISPSEPDGTINVPVETPDPFTTVYKGAIPNQVYASPAKMGIPGIDEKAPEYVSGMLTPPQHQTMYKYFEELEEQGISEATIGGKDWKAYELNPDLPFYQDIFNFFKSGFSETKHSEDGFVTESGRFLWIPTTQGPVFAHKKRQFEQNYIAKNDLPENYFDPIEEKYGKDWLFGVLKDREKWETIIEFANVERGITYNDSKGNVTSSKTTGSEGVTESGEPISVFNRYADLPWKTVYADYLSNLPISSPAEYQFRSDQSGDLHTYFMLDANWDQPRTEGSGRMFGEVKEANPYAEFLSDFKTPTFGKLTDDINHVIDIIGTPMDEWAKIEFDSAKLEQGVYSAEEKKDYRLWDRYKASPDAAKNQFKLSSLPIMQHTPMALREETARILDRLYQRWLADPEREGDNYLEYVDKNNYFGMINPKRKNIEEQIDTSVVN